MSRFRVKFRHWHGHFAAQFIYLLLIGAFYLPVIFFVLQRRDEGYGFATWLVILYAVLALVFNVAEAVWQNEDGISLLLELQIYASLTLAAIFMLALQIFLKRDSWWIWLGVWAALGDRAGAHPDQRAQPAGGGVDEWGTGAVPSRARSCLVHSRMADPFHRHHPRPCQCRQAIPPAALPQPSELLVVPHPDDAGQ
jgi:hypothetical protein